MKITQGKRRELSSQEVAQLRRRLANSHPIPIYSEEALKRMNSFRERVATSNLPESQKMKLALYELVDLFQNDNLYSTEVQHLIRKESPFKHFVLATIYEVSGGSKVIQDSDAVTELARHLGADLESSVESNLGKAFILSFREFIHRNQIEDALKIKGIIISLENNGLISLQQAVQFRDAIDVQCNIICGRVIYVDDQIALTWGCSNQETLTLGQLMFAVKDPDGLWSYDKDDEVRVSGRSLQKAQRACRNWTGKVLCGEIIHDESRRWCEFLGLEVKQEMAYLRPLRRLSQGFGKVAQKPLRRLAKI